MADNKERRVDFPEPGGPTTSSDELDLRSNVMSLRTGFAEDKAKEDPFTG
jgi:hypothetical protein